MKTRIIALCLLLAAVIAARWWLSPDDDHHQPGNPTTSASTPPSPPATATSASPAKSQAVAAAENDDDRSHLADGLNSPNGTAADDVHILDEIFAQWLTNFPHTGNPVGTNLEITAALMGKNKLGLALIPPGHPAINRDGRLADRWGTPYRFHQWSGTVMEIISAGPDKKFGTADDVSSQGQPAKP